MTTADAGRHRTVPANLKQILSGSARAGCGYACLDLLGRVGTYLIQQLFRSSLLLTQLLCFFPDQRFQIVRVLFHSSQQIVHEIFTVAPEKRLVLTRKFLLLRLYFIIKRIVPLMVSNVGLSSGLSLQHLSINSIKSSGQSLVPIAGRKGGASLAATLVIISAIK